MAVSHELMPLTAFEWQQKTVTHANDVELNYTDFEPVQLHKVNVLYGGLRHFRSAFTRYLISLCKGHTTHDYLTLVLQL